jgi:hypothetical protein
MAEDTVDSGFVVGYSEVELACRRCSVVLSRHKTAVRAASALTHCLVLRDSLRFRELAFDACSPVDNIITAFLDLRRLDVGV